jgi:protein SCO1/2
MPEAQALRKRDDRMSMKHRRLLAAGLLSFDLHGATTDLPVQAPRQEFIAPAPGSYALQVIQRAADGNVLDIDGRVYRLDRYTTGRITLLGFIYTYCVDPVGCPLAFETFSGLRKRLLAMPDLARQMRFVSLSFDPVNDTPPAMKNYAGNLADAGSPLRWHFLTTRSVAELKPIIDGFGQDVSVQRDAQGRPTRLYNHMLKIFLLDAQGRVREIYSTAFLQAEVMFNDIRTLALEQQRGRQRH